MSTNWFQKAVDETAGELETDLKSGLSDDAARHRLARYGPNELAEAPKASALVIFLRQLKNPLLIILMVGAVISFYLVRVSWKNLRGRKFPCAEKNGRILPQRGWKINLRLQFA